MDYYLLQNHWSSLVRTFKDSEKTYDQEPYASEQLCMDIVDYVRYTRIRQYKLFQQKRGEDFERMVQTLESREHSPESLRRFLDNDELWSTTLELAEE